MESIRNRQCEMKTDLNLLLECLKYQMDQPASQKEALVTIYSVCQQNRDASDYFREIGGLMFVNNLVKSSVHSIVKESALFTLGGLAENNVFCQEILCTSALFKDLHMFLTQKNSSMNLKRMSVYVLLVLVSNNKSGQTYVRESGCLDVLLQLFRTTLAVSEVNLSDNSINQCYQLWSSVCSALCACVNNPQNEDNQKSCSLVFPYAKDRLQSCTKPEIVRPICSFIGLTVANNSKLQHFFVSIGGLAVLDKLLAKLIDNSSGNYSNKKLAVVVTKTLDACIADNYAVGVTLARYNIVPNLLTLLSSNMLNSGEKFSIILSLGHCTDGCEENQYVLIKNNGLPLMIQALTESQDEELNKAATFVLQNCKQITEKLSVTLSEHSLNMEDARHTEVDLQNRHGILEDYREKVKQILYRIEQLENEHQEHEEENQKRNTYEVFHNSFCERHQNENQKLHQDDKIGKQWYNAEQSHNNSTCVNEKVRRQIFTDSYRNISPEDVMQTTSKHFRVNASDQSFSRDMRCTRMKPLLNLASHQQIATKFVNGSSKNEQLQSANRNPINALVFPSEHNNLHSTDNMEAASTNKVRIPNKSTVFQSGNFNVQLSECLFKQPGAVVRSVRQQVPNTEPFILSSCRTNSGTNHILTTYKDPKISELRCSGCITTGLSLNSRNFCKILQSCQHLCDQHKVILQTEMRYKRNLKRSIISSKDCSTDSDGNCEAVPKNIADLRAKHDTFMEKQTKKDKRNPENEGLGESHTYSYDKDENTEISLADVPSLAFQRSKRRIRKDFTSEEINYLLDGVKKKGHHWNSILWAYPFQKGRTNVDLAKKYCKLQRSEKNKKTPNVC